MMAAKKKAAKKAPKMAADKKPMSTDEAIAALKQWERADIDGRIAQIELAYGEFDVDLLVGWIPYGHTSKSLSVAITKALAAAKKAGHA